MLEAAAHHHWPNAPVWAVDAGIVGKALVLLALFAFLASVTCWSLAGTRPKFENWGKRAFIAGGCCLFATIVCLGALFAANQFEYTYVFSHGDANTELKYKIAGIWSGQQGSFLLWACTSSIFGILAARCSGIYRRWFTVVFAVFLATLCGILAYETPFEMARLNGIALQPPQGAGLTPSLQNYWVVIHPPTIFMGFGSLTVAFAFGMAAMLTRNAKDWIPLVRPWVILSTAILGLGLSMGGFWAYETLGWGGFWMWDPVENVSFVPWIFSIALLHGFIVQTARTRWVGGNLALAGLPFIAFCYGTFLTRSGFLADASVHSFAEMNRSALWILASFVVLAALAYYIVFALVGAGLPQTDAKPPNLEQGVDREGFYVSGVLLLCGLAAAVAVGMSVPFYLSLVHRPNKVVEEPLYHQVVVWFFLPILVLMGIAPFVSWRKMGWLDVLNKLINIIAITLGALGIILWLIKSAPPAVQPAFDASVPFPKIPVVSGAVILLCVSGLCFAWNAWRGVAMAREAKPSVWALIGYFCIAIPLAGLFFYGVSRLLHHGPIGDYLFPNMAPLVPWVMVLIGVCLFCFVANAWRIGETFKRAKMSIGGFVAHIGIAILLAGLIISRGLERKDSVVMQPGDEATSMGYRITYRGMSRPEEEGVLKRDNKALFEMDGPDGSFIARPGLYYIIGNDQKLQTVVWPHVEHMGTHDLYFALQQPQFDVWQEPQTFKPGETRAPNDRDTRDGPISITYNGFKMEGAGGAVGTKFVADLVVRITGNDGSVATHAAKPSLAIAQGGIVSDPVKLDDTFSVTLESLDASDHSATLQMHFNEPVFPIDIFYKPMVILVWLGAGVTFLGGVLAAISRRPFAKKPPSERETT